MMAFPSKKEILVYWLKRAGDVILALACIALLAWATREAIDKTIEHEAAQQRAKGEPVYVED